MFFSSLIFLYYIFTLKINNNIFKIIVNLSCSNTYSHILAIHLVKERERVEREEKIYRPRRMMIEMKNYNFLSQT